MSEGRNGRKEAYAACRGMNTCEGNKRKSGGGKPRLRTAADEKWVTFNDPIDDLHCLAKKMGGLTQHGRRHLASSVCPNTKGCCRKVLRAGGKIKPISQWAETDIRGLPCQDRKVGRGGSRHLLGLHSGCSAPVAVDQKCGRPGDGFSICWSGVAIIENGGRRETRLWRGRDCSLPRRRLDPQQLPKLPCRNAAESMRGFATRLGQESSVRIGTSIRDACKRVLQFIGGISGLW